MPKTEPRTGLQRLGDALTKAEAINERLEYDLRLIREHLNAGNVDAALNIIEEALGDE